MNTSMHLPELYFNSIHTIAQQCNSEPINEISVLFYAWFPVLPTIQFLHNQTLESGKVHCLLLMLMSDTVSNILSK